MYQRILVPVDGSAAAERGLQEAVRMAVASGARLRLLQVVDDYPALTEMTSPASLREVRRHLRGQAEKSLARACRSALNAGARVDPVLREVTHERVADVIIDEVSQGGCELIVMGTHGRRGFSRLMLGSDAELVVRLSPVPVLLVRQGDSTV